MSASYGDRRVFVTRSSASNWPLPGSGMRSRDPYRSAIASKSPPHRHARRGGQAAGWKLELLELRRIAGVKSLASRGATANSPAGRNKTSPASSAATLDARVSADGVAPHEAAGSVTTFDMYGST